MDNATIIVTTEHLETLSLRDQSPETDDDSVQSDTSDLIVDLIPALETTGAKGTDTFAARPRSVLVLVGWQQDLGLTCLQSDHKKIVRVRLFKNANDWRHINQVDVRCDSNGDLDLRQVSLHLNITGDCRVSNIVMRQECNSPSVSHR